MNLQDIIHLNGSSSLLLFNEPIKHLLTDSRKALISANALFFCIQGKNHDSHTLIPELVARGIRNFVVEKPVNQPEGCNIIQVKNSVEALQKIAQTHRNSFTYPVVGITGSNGKTIVKEWLTSLLSTEKTVIKSPKSYNSQIGVPLSLWQMNASHEIGVFEAGISQPGEMEKLQQLIQPTLGIFTNLGTAHAEGFESKEQKLHEKLILFKNCPKVIIHNRNVSTQQLPNQISWGESENNDYQLTFQENEHCTLSKNGKSWSFKMPFRQKEYRENLLHCLVACLELGVVPSQSKIDELRSVPMRMSLKKGIYNTDLIDDTYNNDLAGLQTALDFTQQQITDKPKTLILSEMHQSGIGTDSLNQQILELIEINQLHQFIAIGSQWQFSPEKNIKYHHYHSTEDFLQDFDFSQLKNQLVLIKGARKFAFEKIIDRLEEKVHQTVFEINFGAFQQNLNYFRSLLQPQTGIMAMVKAFAYGSGDNEIAHFLEYNRIDYFGVAYMDEGIKLRKQGITTPIMVMNPTRSDFDAMVKYRLEPEIYDFYLLQACLDYAVEKKTKMPVHIKLDTGMHRLGFEEKSINKLLELLNNQYLEVKSIFSHLAAADEEHEQAFTTMQCESFLHIANQLTHALGYKPMYHILNSAGIQAYPQYQFDMARLGIGLYGVGLGKNQEKLAPIGSLKTSISQIKHITKGESIGYSRKGKATENKTIATVPIGYADGYDRRFGNGIGKMMLHGKEVAVIGNVCMDMTMIDITGIEAEVGDTVIVFGEKPSINDLAQAIGTIPYEILTNVGERVKRVFFTE